MPEWTQVDFGALSADETAKSATIMARDRTQNDIALDSNTKVGFGETFEGELTCDAFLTTTNIRRTSDDGSRDLGAYYSPLTGTNDPGSAIVRFSATKAQICSIDLNRAADPDTRAPYSATFLIFNKNSPALHRHSIVGGPIAGSSIGDRLAPLNPPSSTLVNPALYCAELNNDALSRLKDGWTLAVRITSRSYVDELRGTVLKVYDRSPALVSGLRIASNACASGIANGFPPMTGGDHAVAQQDMTTTSSNRTTTVSSPGRDSQSPDVDFVRAGGIVCEKGGDARRLLWFPGRYASDLPDTCFQIFDPLVMDRYDDFDGRGTGVIRFLTRSLPGSIGDTVSLWTLPAFVAVRQQPTTHNPNNAPSASHATGVEPWWVSGRTGVFSAQDAGGGATIEISPMLSTLAKVNIRLRSSAGDVFCRAEEHGVGDAYVESGTVKSFSIQMRIGLRESNICHLYIQPRQDSISVYQDGCDPARRTDVPSRPCTYHGVFKLTSVRPEGLPSPPPDNNALTLSDTSQATPTDASRSPQEHSSTAFQETADVVSEQALTGVVTVGQFDATIAGATFEAASDSGHTILAACPSGTVCEIHGTVRVRGSTAIVIAVSSARRIRDARPSVTDTLTTGAEPFFMQRPVTEDDLRGKSMWELDVMRNEIYARHGRRFARNDLQSYFAGQPWYEARYEASEFPTSLMTDVQLRNVQAISEYQKRLR